MTQGDLLVDDELVALAVRGGGAWPTPLPTLDVEDADQLLAGALRGLRSLAVRGALVGGETVDSFRTIEAAVGAPPSAVLYRGDDPDGPLGGFSGYAMTATARGWLLDEVTPAGMHRFSEVTLDALVEFAVAMLELVQRPDMVEGARMCLALPGDGETVMIAATRDSFALVNVDTAGAESPGPDPGGTLVECVRDLLEKHAARTGAAELP